VQSYWEKVAAERAAERVSGVKAVANELEVRLPSSSQRTDEDIVRAAVNALEWSVLMPANKIKVKVSKGWVTLEGSVASRDQLAALRWSCHAGSRVDHLADLAVEHRMGYRHFGRGQHVIQRRFTVDAVAGGPSRCA
jgi:hypothetical protein